MLHIRVPPPRSFSSVRGPCSHKPVSVTPLLIRVACRPLQSLKCPDLWSVGAVMILWEVNLQCAAVMPLSLIRPFPTHSTRKVNEYIHTRMHTWCWHRWNVWFTWLHTQRKDDSGACYHTLTHFTVVKLSFHIPICCVTIWILMWNVNVQQQHATFGHFSFFFSS